MVNLKCPFKSPTCPDPSRLSLYCRLWSVTRCNVTVAVADIFNDGLDKDGNASFIPVCDWPEHSQWEDDNRDKLTNTSNEWMRDAQFLELYMKLTPDEGKRIAHQAQDLFGSCLWATGFSYMLDH